MGKHIRDCWISLYKVLPNPDGWDLPMSRDWRAAWSLTIQADLDLNTSTRLYKLHTLTKCFHPLGLGLLDYKVGTIIIPSLSVDGKEIASGMPCEWPAAMLQKWPFFPSTSVPLQDSWLRHGFCRLTALSQACGSRAQVGVYLHLWRPHWFYVPI